MMNKMPVCIFSNKLQDASEINDPNESVLPAKIQFHYHPNQDGDGGNYFNMSPQQSITYSTILTGFRINCTVGHNQTA